MIMHCPKCWKELEGIESISVSEGELLQCACGIKYFHVCEGNTEKLKEGES
jgi:hypothetical protein